MSPTSHERPLDSACIPEGEPGQSWGGVDIAVDAPSVLTRTFSHLLIDLDDTLYQVPKVTELVFEAIKGLQSLVPGRISLAY